MRRTSQLLFFVALLLGGYVAGSATDGGKELLAVAANALRGAWESLASPAELPGGRFVNVAARDAAAHRVQLFAPALAGPVLMAGGRHYFKDRCPGFVGCLALEYDRRGRFAHAYPFRPEAYEAVLVHAGLAEPVGYEQAVGFDFGRHADVFAIDGYSNGDLAVVLHSRLSFPPELGIARVDRDGRPRWFRADGSHHWPTVAHGRLRGVGAGLPDAVVVPSRRMRAGPPRDTRPPRSDAKFGRNGCARHFVEYLHVIDGAGALLREVAVADALHDSRHAPLRRHGWNACDPLHLNSVAVLTGGGSGLAAGDLLVSLRGPSALAALDGEDGRLKRIWRGSFYGQHGARELAGPAGPTFLLFDNWGREDGYTAGRLLSLDPRSGRERTVFPNASSPGDMRIRSRLRGGVSVAPDGSRAIVHAHKSGLAVEVDVATGEVTAAFRPLDDVSAHPGAAGELDKAFRWNMRDFRYVAGRPARMGTRAALEPR